MNIGKVVKIGDRQPEEIFIPSKPLRKEEPIHVPEPKQKPTITPQKKEPITA